MLSAYYGKRLGVLDCLTWLYNIMFCNMSLSQAPVGELSETHTELFQSEESEDVGGFPAAPPSVPVVGKFCQTSKYELNVQVKNNSHPIPGPFCLPFCGSAPIMMLYV